MKRHRNAQSVKNFILFLFVLQNCRQVRTQQRHDGLFKFDNSFKWQQLAEPLGKRVEVSQFGFNYSNIFETLWWRLCAPRILRDKSDAITNTEKRSERTPKSVVQQLSDRGKSVDLNVVLVTPKPFNIVTHLQLQSQSSEHETLEIPNPLNLDDFQHEEPIMGFMKPINSFINQQQDHSIIQQGSGNETFNIFEQSTLKATEQPFTHIGLIKSDKDAIKITNQDREPAESLRAPGNSNKRKRIRRRRKRIRRRRRRKRKRNRKQRKRKRRNRRKKRGKRRRRKKGDEHNNTKKRKKPTKVQSPGQPAQVLFTSAIHKPYYHDNHEKVTTTKRPSTVEPIKKIKYILRHSSSLKKKKKEYLGHLGHVLYPFINFVAFFTVLNPFTLGVFLFSLLSPVVFGFLGFVALSVLVKPILSLVFGVKDNVDAINRRHSKEQKRREHWRLGLRPITIHKHFYQQHSIPPPPHSHPHRRNLIKTQYNPMLPHVRKKMLKDNIDILRFR